MLGTILLVVLMVVLAPVVARALGAMDLASHRRRIRRAQRREAQQRR